MPDQPHTRGASISKSGVFPRPVLEPETKVESARPTSLPEQRDTSGATGHFPAVGEGIDNSAEASDDDRATRK
ncbi:MAG: hypothetical protein SF029_08885 [bacterium]|nr:hypothetical protein [bacterium]